VASDRGAFPRGRTPHPTSSTDARIGAHHGKRNRLILYAILTLFSCGLFAIIWAVQRNQASKSAWLCTACGTPYYPPPTLGRPAAPPKPMSPAARFALKATLGMATALALCVGLAIAFFIMQLVHARWVVGAAKPNETVRTMLLSKLSAGKYKCNEPAVERAEDGLGWANWRVRCATEKTSYLLSFDGAGEPIRMERELK
jgi:hypothetical protein